MTCRSTNTTPSLSCFGGNNGGAQLSYDNEQRLIGWQNAPTSPTTTDAFLYDGEGNRVEQQVTQSGVTTTTAYVGNLEESATSGSTSTTTTYYYAGSLRIALAVGGSATGTVSYLGTDALGSSTVALSASGTETAAQLDDPYGTGRYSSGAMPTDYAYTGQHSDVATGLDYYNARYYDPLASQFVSADSVLPGKGYDVWGLSRYAYVEGNPETRSDPTGHCWLICAAIAAVVTTVAVTATTAVAQYVTTGSVNWGQAATVGLTAGLVVGAAIALGPLAGAAIDAIGAGGGLAGAASAVGGEAAAGLAGDADIVASSALADKVAVGVAMGGIMGGGEGVAQGLAAGDRGGALALDAVTGMAGGAVGGAVGAGIGPAWLSGAFGNGAGNLTGQAINHITHGTGFDGLSFGLSLIWGGFAGGQTGANKGNAVLNSFIAVALDFGSQYAESLANAPLPPSATPAPSPSPPPSPTRRYW